MEVVVPLSRYKPLNKSITLVLSKCTVVLPKLNYSYYYFCFCFYCVLFFSTKYNSWILYRFSEWKLDFYMNFARKKLEKKLFFREKAGFLKFEPCDHPVSKSTQELSPVALKSFALFISSTCISLVPLYCNFL